MLKPVTLPPGCAKLATKPLPTGSATVANTMGMVRVCCISARVVGVTCERIRSGRSATSSLAYRSLESELFAPQRVSIRMLRPTVHPTFWSPSRNAAIQARPSLSLSANAISTPMRRTPAGCCARATNGHAAVAPPPRTPRKSRRFMPAPRLKRRYSSGSNECFDRGGYRHQIFAAAHGNCRSMGHSRPMKPLPVPNNVRS